MNIFLSTFPFRKLVKNAAFKSDLNVFDLAVEALNKRKAGNVTFVQVGAFDGVSLDPLRKHVLANRWRGLLVEPQRDAFERLKENYGGQQLSFEKTAIKVNYGGQHQLAFENTAITDIDGPVRMLAGRRQGETTVSSGLLSGFYFKAKMVLRGDYAKTITVPGTTMHAALAKHGITAFDLLQVDAEGCDDRIVRQALAICLPPVIHFESLWIPNQRLAVLYAMLRERGYAIHHGVGDPCDSVAVRNLC